MPVYRAHTGDHARRAHRLLDLIRSYGVEPPTEVTAAESKNNAARQALSDIVDAANGRVALEAVTGHVLDGSDDALDVLDGAEVQRWNNARLLVGDNRWPEMHRLADRPLVQAVLANGDAITDVLRPKFDADVVSMTGALKALGSLGDYDLDKPESVVRLGGDAAAAFVHITEAESTIRAADGVLQQFMLLSGEAPDSGQRPILRWADLTHEQTQEYGKTSRPADVARNGHTISLATPDQYLARVSAVNAEAPHTTGPRFSGPLAATVLSR